MARGVTENSEKAVYSFPRLEALPRIWTVDRREPPCVRFLRDEEAREGTLPKGSFPPAPIHSGSRSTRSICVNLFRDQSPRNPITAGCWPMNPAKRDFTVSFTFNDLSRNLSMSSLDRRYSPPAVGREIEAVAAKFVDAYSPCVPEQQVWGRSRRLDGSSQPEVSESKEGDRHECTDCPRTSRAREF